MSKKISELIINNFRGFPKKSKIDLINKKSLKSCSLLIFGDNGSGKSSIADAIEFALQARIERVGSLKSELKPLPVSLKKFDSALVEVVLEDNETITRNINITLEGNKSYKIGQSNAKVHPSFNIAPMVFRRNDILRFIQTSSHQKQLLISGYIKDVKENWKGDDKLEKNAKQDSLIQLKNKRRDLMQKFADKLNISSDQIPFRIEEYDEFVNKNVYSNISLEQTKKLQHAGFVVKKNTDIIEMAKSIRQLHCDIHKSNTEITELGKYEKQKANDKNKNFRQKKLERIFLNAEDYLTESFKKISSFNYVDKIELRLGDITEVSLDIIVHLKNGKKVQPNNIFSEANLDLLALLIFLSIIKEAANQGQEKVLVLDDVLQSVDATIRHKFFDFFLSSFKEWQLILTVHDRLFRDQIRLLFKKHNVDLNEIEILKWDFESGPQIINLYKESDFELVSAIQTNNPIIICSTTGLTLEKICYHLSYSLPISVVRKKDDKYTMGDLFPGVHSKLKKTNLNELIFKIEHSLYTRNLIGAHYNEWALSLTNTEILEFADNVLLFYNSIFCKDCSTWITFNTDDKLYKCNCKKLIVSSIA